MATLNVSRAAGFLVVCVLSLGDAVAADGPRRPPATRLESVFLGDSDVTVRATQPIGVVHGRNGGRVDLQVLSVFDLDYGVAARGVVVHVVSENRKEQTVYIDARELPGLVDGFDYLAALEPELRPRDLVEAKVQTKGSFTLLRSSSPGPAEFLILAGRGATAAILVDDDGFVELLDLFEDAEAAIAASP